MGLDKALKPVRLAGLSLRNRIIKTATFEGMCPDGIPSEGLIRHHSDIAAGGAGMTTVAYCGVSPDGLTFSDQMYMHEGIAPQVRALTAAVHQQGGAVSAQLAHCGGFSRNRPRTSRRPLGPHFGINQYGLFSGLPFSGAMTQRDIDRTVREYGEAAAFVKRQGFDAAEIHMGHGYLLSQFISPATNRRRDAYGGSLDKRMRLPVEVLASVRQAVGDDFPVLAKLNLGDGFKGGVTTADAVAATRLLAREGVDAIVMSGGFVSRSPMYLFRGDSPLPYMIPLEPNPVQRLAMKLLGASLFRSDPFRELYFLEEARQVRQAVDIPLVYLGGVSSAAAIEQAMDEGFDFVAMGRALIEDPNMIRRLAADPDLRSACIHCNRCVATMSTPRGVHCVLHP